MNPSGVVRSVAEIFHPVCGELGFFSAPNVAYPQVVIFDEGGELSIGRKFFLAAGGLGFFFFQAAITQQIACPAIGFGLEGDSLAILGKCEGDERKMVCVILCSGGRGECGGEFRVVEGGLVRALRGIKKNELTALRAGFAIPKAVVLQPGGANVVVNERGGVEGQELGGALVIGIRKRARRSGSGLLRSRGPRPAHCDRQNRELERTANHRHFESHSNSPLKANRRSIARWCESRASTGGEPMPQWERRLESSVLEAEVKAFATLPGISDLDFQLAHRNTPSALDSRNL